MAAPTNTITALNNIGQREDLQDVIYRVAPEETPFISNIGRTSVSAVYHEWQTEDLAAPSATNAILSGDDAGTLGAGNFTTRVGNYCQISRKTGVVSGTQQSVDLAGRDDELDRQKTLKGLELRRDMEIRVVGNNASRVESGSDARLTGGASAWMTTNTSNGAGGSNGGWSANIVGAATPGTARAFTEDLVKSVHLQCFNSGGRPNMAIMGGGLKQKFSSFPGIADIRVNTGRNQQASIVAGAEVYVGDFGQLTLVAHQYALPEECLLIQTDHWAIGTLRPIFSEPLAKTGDADKFQIVSEYCLVARNQKSSGAIRAVQP